MLSACMAYLKQHLVHISHSPSHLSVYFVQVDASGVLHYSLSVKLLPLPLHRTFFLAFDTQVLFCSRCWSGNGHSGMHVNP